MHGLRQASKQIGNINIFEILGIVLVKSIFLILSNKLNENELFYKNYGRHEFV